MSIVIDRKLQGTEAFIRIFRKIRRIRIRINRNPLYIYIHTQAPKPGFYLCNFLILWRHWKNFFCRFYLHFSGNSNAQNSICFHKLEKLLVVQKYLNYSQLRQIRTPANPELRQIRTNFFVPSANRTKSMHFTPANPDSG